MSVLENQAVGTLLVGDYIPGVSCTDADGTARFSTLTYTLSSGDATLFSVTSNGELRTAAAFDRELQNTYTFNLSASDGLASVTVSIHVSIGDVNDNAPVFVENSLVFSLPEATPVGTVIGHTLAFDIDLNGNQSIT